MTSLFRVRGVVLAAVLVAAAPGWGRAQDGGSGDAVLAEARQAYEATDYERARELLDSIIAGLGTLRTTPEQRALLAAAYELRARARFNLDDVEAARSDFQAVLLLEPAYLLSELVNPRVLALYEEVRRSTVGTVRFAVTPADAQVFVNDVRLTALDAPLVLVGGTHSISARRTGYAPLQQSFTVFPGSVEQLIPLDLARVSSTLSLVTSPANIEVIVDGISRGVTELDPDKRADDGALLSKPFVLTDVANGRHRLSFRRECFIGAEREMDVARADDYALEPVRLTPAVATVTVNATELSATVFVDDVPRGPAPMTMNDICQGPHTIEIRTPHGRHVRRMELKAGQSEVISARVRPAFAIISDSGASGGVRGAADLRMIAETLFQETSAVTLFAPPEAIASEMMTANSLPVEWLAFDMLKNPIGAAEKIGEAARSQLGTEIARKLGAQGLAAVAREPGDPNGMLLILLAPGSAEPDVFRWRPDDPQSVRAAIRQLDQAPSQFRSTIGVLAIDVHDLEGVVVAAVEPGGSADAAGIKPGDTIVSAAGAPVKGAVELTVSIRARAAGESIPLEIRDGAGMPKSLTVAVQAVPNVVSLADRDLPANKLTLEYTYRASVLADALDEAAVRLNLAALAHRLKNRQGAARELDRVRQVLTEGKVPPALVDSIAGTVHYLTGLNAEAGGDMAGAETAWRQAAQSRGSLLIDEGGEAIRDAAERQLGALVAQRSGPPR